MILETLRNFFNNFKHEFLIIALGAVFFGGIFIGNKIIPTSAQPTSNPFEQLQREMTAINNAVLPAEGFATKIVLGDAIVKLVENGVIDIKKFEELYAGRGGLSEEQKKLLTEPNSIPLKITPENANFLINIMWPLGIADKSKTLSESEAGAPENVNNLAATGGWALGKKDNGGAYYNQFEIVKLTEEQEQLAKRVAENIYRPCCGNSTAFPDCNHGAALLGMIQLGASQGLTEKELYEEALKFNSFWFPEEYTKMALVFQYLEKKQWRELDPKILLSAQYSSSRGFRKNVAAPLANMGGIGPQIDGGGSCAA